ncbi:MAG: hypothetical protein ACLGHY_03015, partial [Gammaproteobacteria bacterium]
VIPASPDATDDDRHAPRAEAARGATAGRTHAALDRVAVLSMPKTPGLLQTGRDVTQHDVS